MSDNIFAKTPWAAGNERVESTKLQNYTLQEEYKDKQLDRASKALSIADQRIRLETLRESMALDIGQKKANVDLLKAQAEHAEINKSQDEESWEWQLSKIESEAKTAESAANYANDINEATLAKERAERKAALAEMEAFNRENKGSGAVPPRSPDRLPTFEEGWSTLVNTTTTTGGQTNLVKQKNKRADRINSEREIRAMRASVHSALRENLLSGKVVPGSLEGIQTSIKGMMHSLIPGADFSDMIDDWTGLAAAKNYDKLTNDITGLMLRLQGRSFTDSDRDFTQFLQVKNTDSKKTALQRMDFFNAHDHVQEFIQETYDLAANGSGQEDPAEVDEFVRLHVLGGKDSIPIMGAEMDLSEPDGIGTRTFEDFVKEQEAIKARTTRGNGSLSIKDRRYLIYKWNKKYAFSQDRYEKLKLEVAKAREEKRKGK